MKRSLLFLLTICLLMTTMLWAQSVGDYRSAVNGGIWNTPATWEIFDGTNWVAATATPGASNNVTIRNGFDVIYDASGKNCKNLYIEAGATLKGDLALPTSSIRYVRINGDSVVVNGTLGEALAPGNNIALENARIGGTVVITGTGTFAPARVRVNSNANTATTIFDIDTKFMYTGSSGTGGSALYPQSDDNTFIFNAGKTITFVDYANLTVGSSVSTASAQNVTYIVKGTVNMPGEHSSFTLLSGTGKTATLIVAPTGVVNIGKDLLTTMVGEGSSIIVDSGAISVGNKARFSNPANFVEGPGSFTLNEGATIEIGAAAGLDPTNGPIRTANRTFPSSATYVYNGTAAQVTGADLLANILRLNINNTEGVTLSQNTTVTDTLFLTAGDLALNGKTLAYAAVTGNGTISETAALNAPTSVDVGGLGAVITSNADLGLTKVRRGFAALDLGGKNSIKRWYEITPTNNASLNATLVFKYEDTELNDLPEDKLALYSSADTGKTWVCQYGTVDAVNNTITLAGIDNFSLWTGFVKGVEGTYYVGNAGTAPGGADPDFPTLKAACDFINAGPVTNDVLVYITSNLTEPENVALAVNTNGHTVTFKPLAGVTPTVTYTQVLDNAGTSGAFVIGTTTASGAPLVPTSNIVIDGSNTLDGTTRDLTFLSAHGQNAYPFRIRGDCDNITIKNCVLVADTAAIAYGIWINPVFTSPDNFLPDNITVENCHITANKSTTGTPIHVYASGTTTLPMENLIVKGNYLVGRTRGVFLNGRTNVSYIEGNTIEINQTTSGYQSSAVIGNTIWSSGVTYILGNDFKMNATANTSASNGIRVVTASGGGKFIVANNFFRGFAAPDNGTNAAEMIGVRCGSPTEIYYNTFVLNDINATSSCLYRAINVAAGSPIIKNNIFVIEENDFSAYCIGGTPGISDFNNFYLKADNAKLHPLYANLEAWQGNGKDLNSVSKEVALVSADDLHLYTPSVGDPELIGIPIEGITTDIDGDLRSTDSPYMGADEGNIPLPPRPAFTALSLVESVDEVNWKPAQGDFETSFQVVLDPANAYQYLNIGTFSVTAPFANDLYGFTIATCPDGFLDYWKTKGVDVNDITAAGDTLWQKYMWEIINKEAPIFYLKASNGELTLIDGLQYLLDAQEKPWRIEGDYLTGLYTYTGKVVSDVGAKSLPITIKVNFNSLAPNLFFSEYIEGSNYNKAIEIYNGSPDTVDLSKFILKAANNGSGWGCYTPSGGSPTLDYRYILPLTGQLAPGQCLVVYHADAAADMITKITNSGALNIGLAYSQTVDDTGKNVPSFNGDDALGLFYGDLLVDIIGDPNNDPGTNWPVAGGVGATSEFTLIRKASVARGNIDWSISAGADEESSEWVVLPRDDWRFIGTHPHLDLVGPEVAAIVTAADSLVQVRFSEPVDPVSAVDLNNYLIGGQKPVFAIQVNPKVISMLLGTKLEPNVPTAMAISGVKDTLLNVMKDFETMICHTVLGELPIDIVSDDFESTMGTWKEPTYSGSTSGILSTSTFALSDEAAYHGTQSAKMVLLDDPAKAGGWFVRVWNSGRPDVKKDSKVFFYVKADNPNIQIRFCFRDDGQGGDNEYLVSPWVDITAFEDDWQLIAVDLTTTPLTSWAVVGNGMISSSDVVSIDCIQLQCPDDVDAVLYIDKLTERPNLTPVKVTLQVGMQAQVLLHKFDPASDSLDVAGNFNGWGVTRTMLRDADQDTVYEVTLDLYPTQRIEYKFRINCSWDDATAEFPFGGPNRVLVVPAQDTVLFCWYNDIDPTQVGIVDGANLPKVYALHQNYPNPFNPTTNIKLDLPEPANVRLVIYNVVGQEVATVYKGHLPAGYHVFNFDANNLASGFYFYRVEANKFTALKKMMIIK